MGERLTGTHGDGVDLWVADGVVRCGGPWTVDRVASLERHLERLAWPEGERVVVDAAGVTALDTAGAWLLLRVVAAAGRGGRHPELTGLRPEHEAVRRMVEGAGAAAPPAVPAAHGLLWRVGRRTWRTGSEAVGILSFVGEVGAAAARAMANPSRVRWRAVLRGIQVAGYDALPIVGLLSFLMGIVIAYQGAVQLQRFGANIFVADLVGLSMLRELSPLVTAIIVAGRSGSAYAAEIGTMKVTEEIDALRTVGIEPMDLLVLPKVLALVVALPLLGVFADVLGVLGGMVMARSTLGVGFQDFLDRLGPALDRADFLAGIGKTPVFAALIAVSGCYQGFQVSGDAESVGRRTTVSVVQSIFAVIVADALFSVAFSRLGI